VNLNKDNSQQPGILCKLTSLNPVLAESCFTSHAHAAIINTSGIGAVFDVKSLEKRIVNRKVMSLPTRVAIPLSEWRVTSFLAILSQRVLAVMPDAPKPVHVFLQKQTGQVW